MGTWSFPEIWGKGSGHASWGLFSTKMETIPLINGKKLGPLVGQQSFPSLSSCNYISHKSEQYPCPLIHAPYALYTKKRWSLSVLLADILWSAVSDEDWLHKLEVKWAFIGRRLASFSNSLLGGLWLSNLRSFQEVSIPLQARILTQSHKLRPGHFAGLHSILFACSPTCKVWLKTTLQPKPQCSSLLVCSLEPC